MTAVTLDGRVFEPPPVRPPWLRPLVVAIVIALHAAALWTLPYFAQPASQPPGEVIVDIEPEAPPAQTPAPPAQEPNPPEQSATEPPPRAAEAPPPEPTPPVAVAPPPPVAELPPPAPIEAQPPLPQPEPPPVANVASPEEQPPLPPPPPAPVELQPPKPPPPPRIEPRLKPVEPVRPKSEPAERKSPSTAPRRTASLETGRPEASASRPAERADAASQSAYISEISGVIRSRMFYPEAARARGARGVVGVSFTIGPSGAVAAFSITRSSGDRDLDSAARTLVQSSHFPPPPAGRVHIATSFNYVPR